MQQIVAHNMDGTSTNNVLQVLKDDVFDLRLIKDERQPSTFRYSFGKTTTLLSKGTHVSGHCCYDDIDDKKLARRKIRVECNLIETIPSMGVSIRDHAIQYTFSIDAPLWVDDIVVSLYLLDELENKETLLTSGYDHTMTLYHHSSK